MSFKDRNKRVIVCGYPKSGNTWLTRLTAEIVGSPVTGFWCEPFNREESMEGGGRKSDFQCFKAHHTFEQLVRTLEIYGDGSEKIIYIYRDPRAIAVSASHYFTFRPRYPKMHTFLSLIPSGLRFYYLLLHRKSYAIDCSVKGLVQGVDYSSWLKVPWANHIKGYLGNESILTLSYEALLEDTLGLANSISRFLHLGRSSRELEIAIERQSFERRKRGFILEGNPDKARFLRRGDSTSWREELSEQHLSYLESNLKDSMRDLGYLSY